MLTIIMPSIAMCLLKNMPHLSFSIISLNMLIYTLTLMNKKYENMLNLMFWSDQFSFPLILLSFFSCFLIFLSSLKMKKIFPLTALIMLPLIVCFLSNSALMFYIMFECSLIPTFLLITSSGNAKDRLMAGLYLMFYTLTASFPLLVSILFFSFNSSFLTNFLSTNNMKFPFLIMSAFLVKLPMFFFHLWLPKAHVEAPVEGSMILASILLKMGAFGVIRFLPWFNKINSWFTSTLMAISLTSMFITSWICTRQKDLKMLIAYSSVSHMALTLASILTLKHLGMKGSILMMISHGITSSALFFMITLMYNSFHSRNTIIFKSLIIISPNISMWWFFFSITNFSAPPSIGMLSEIMMFMTLLNWNLTNFLLILMSSLSISIFCILLFSLTSHSTNSVNINFFNVTKKSFISMFTHLTPLILMFLNPNSMM